MSLFREIIKIEDAAWASTYTDANSSTVDLAGNTYVVMKNQSNVELFGIVGDGDNKSIDTTAAAIISWESFDSLSFKYDIVGEFYETTTLVPGTHGVDGEFVIGTEGFAVAVLDNGDLDADGDLKTIDSGGTPFGFAKLGDGLEVRDAPHVDGAHTADNGTAETAAGTAYRVVWIDESSGATIVNTAGEDFTFTDGWFAIHFDVNASVYKVWAMNADGSNFELSTEYLQAADGGGWLTLNGLSATDIEGEYVSVILNNDYSQDFTQTILPFDWFGAWELEDYIQDFSNDHNAGFVEYTPIYLMVEDNGDGTFGSPLNVPQSYDGTEATSQIFLVEDPATTASSLPIYALAANAINSNPAGDFVFLFEAPSNDGNLIIKMQEVTDASGAWAKVDNSPITLTGIAGESTPMDLLGFTGVQVPVFTLGAGVLGATAAGDYVIFPQQDGNYIQGYDSSGDTLLGAPVQIDTAIGQLPMDALTGGGDGGTTTPTTPTTPTNT